MSERSVVVGNCDVTSVRSSDAPHIAGGSQVDYRIVIPTRGRWKPACSISSERSMKTEQRPFILVKTLSFLRRQGIAPERVELWTADEEERRRYHEALKSDAYWGGGAACLKVGVPGILRQRNHIVKSHSEGAYLVSLDDDVAEMHWKFAVGNGPPSPLEPLPPGSFEQLIYHARGLLKKHKSFIWGLATTVGKNPMGMQLDGVSTKNGEINGFCYGFINRHSEDILPCLEDATEDAERSLRYFHKDRIVMRYRMYCCETKCFGFAGGIQDSFEGHDIQDRRAARKVAERRAAARLHSMFPAQTFPPTEKKTCATLEVSFRPVGGPVVPTTSVAALKAANEAEKQWAARRKAEKEAAKKLVQYSQDIQVEKMRQLQHAEELQQSTVKLVASPARCSSQARFNQVLPKVTDSIDALSIAAAVEVICIDDDDSDDEEEAASSRGLDKDSQEFAVDAQNTVAQENNEFEAAIHQSSALCYRSRTCTDIRGVVEKNQELGTSPGEAGNSKQLQQLGDACQSDDGRTGGEPDLPTRHREDPPALCDRAGTFGGCLTESDSNGNPRKCSAEVKTTLLQVCTRAVVPQWYVGLKWPDRSRGEPSDESISARKRLRLCTGAKRIFEAKEWEVSVLSRCRSHRDTPVELW